MKWVKFDDSVKLAIKSWCETIEDSAMGQARNLANHPAVYSHVALMPDCHTGYGMPIGGVIGCLNTVIPNAVGVDIGCGMAAIETDYSVAHLQGDKAKIRAILLDIKKIVPLGEGNAHPQRQQWDRLDAYLDSVRVTGETTETRTGLPGWHDPHVWKLAYCNLGTLGGRQSFYRITSLTRREIMDDATLRFQKLGVSDCLLLQFAGLAVE